MYITGLRTRCIVICDKHDKAPEKFFRPSLVRALREVNGMVYEYMYFVKKGIVGVSDTMM